MLVLLFCTGVTCGGPKHQEGGGAVTTVPQTVHDENWEEGLQPLTMGMNQPENPEGSSTMRSKSIVTTHHMDGTVSINHTETETSIGGSQALADIYEKYGTAAHFQNLLACLMGALAAWRLFKWEWPICGFIMIVGSPVCLFWSWYALPISMALCGLATLSNLKAAVLQKLT